MSDDMFVTPAGSGVKISLDEITKLNGVTVPAVKMQRNKQCYGPDSEATDVTEETPLPVHLPSGRGTSTKSVQSVVTTTIKTLLAARSTECKSRTIQVLSGGAIWLTTDGIDPAKNATFKMDVGDARTFTKEEGIPWEAFKALNDIDSATTLVYVEEIV